MVDKNFKKCSLSFFCFFLLPLNPEFPRRTSRTKICYGFLCFRFSYNCMLKKFSYIIFLRGILRGRDHMVVWFTITCAYHHKSCEFEPRPWPGVLDATLSDSVCQWLAIGQWFSLDTLVSFTNKTTTTI